MKENCIKYNYNNNYFKMMNDVYGVLMQRNKNIKKTLTINKTFNTFIVVTILKTFFILFGFLVLLVSFSKVYDVNIETLGLTISTMIIFIIGFILFFYVFCIFYIIFLKTKISNSEYELNVNESGIIEHNIFSKRKITCNWDKIISIVVTKYSIVILTNNKKINLFFPRNDEILESLSKFNPNLFNHII